MKKLCFFVMLAICISSCQKGEVPATLVIRGGKIYTMSPSGSIVEAIAVRGDQIVATGSSRDMERYVGKGTKIIELDGRIATPGIIESHAHLMGVGFNELDLDLMKAKNFDEIVSMVKEAAAKVQPGQWIIGRGWHQDKWDVKPDKMVKGFPVHEKLSAAAPNNPVFLSHASGHAAIANAKAMQIAGVSVLSREQIRKGEGEGGEIIRDVAGNPTGLFNERAMQLVHDQIPDNSEERNAQALDLALKACLRNGITSFHDAGAPSSTVELYRQFREQGKLSIRLYVMISGSDREYMYKMLARGPEVDTTGWLTVRSIKLYSDGALGSRGAWLLAPYSDRPETQGMATLSMDTVLKVSRLALEKGFQVCTHAIGDRANREVLDRYELAIRTAGGAGKDHRFRIEHAQHIDPADLPRFARLGIVASMEAIHMSSDRPWAIERLGEKRIVDGAYMWKSLLKSGAKVINGTDAPVEPINPIPCFYAAVTRKTLGGEPDGGYEAKEKMTREEALRSYTLDAAYGAFEEKMKGSLEAGKLADITIFTKDIMSIPESEILNAQVSTTIVGGKVAYEQ